MEIYNPFNGPGAPEVKLDTVTIDAGLVNIGKVTSDSALNLNAVNVTAGTDLNLASAADVSATASSFISTLGSFTLNDGSASGNSTFGGDVTLNVNTITAGDSVSLFSYAGLVSGLPNGGDLTISDSDITATAGSISLNSDKKLTVDQSTSINGRSIHAKTDINVNGQSDVEVDLSGGRPASSIKADIGIVDITSSSGTVSLNGGIVEGGAAISLSGQIGVSVIGTSLKSDNDDVTVQSPDGAVIMAGGSVEASKNVKISSTASMNVDGTTLMANSDPTLLTPSITLDNGN